MRSEHKWFYDRATTTWRASPGRSFLVLVPQGCDEVATSTVLADWMRREFQPPEHSRNHRPAVVRISTDVAGSARQFVRRVRRELQACAGEPLDVDADDYPSVELESVVDATHAQGLYPVLCIERFHAFARMGDSELLSVLSALRTLEHSTRVTTLAFSPLSYEQLRGQLNAKGQFPFVNSAYGDNHDQAVMTPLSRAEFVAAAERRAIPITTAQRLFTFGGGPDTIYEALMDAYAASGEHRLVERAVARIGDRLDRFISESFDQPSYNGDGLMERLAVGELRPLEREAVLSHVLAKFIVHEDKGGRLGAASPILARTILRTHRGPMAGYGDSLTALASGDHARARSLTATLQPTVPRLAVFRDAVQLVCAVDGGAESGLLGIDWVEVGRLGGRLGTAEEASPAWREWGATLERWAEAIVGKGTTKDDARQRLDALTVQASNPDVFLLLEFALSRYVRRAGAINSPSDRVRRLLMVPEAVLQSLAARFCGIDYASPPEALPAGPDYDTFFEGRETFRYEGGRKLEMTALLVIVPAILSYANPMARLLELADPRFVRPLHQKLVGRLRNPMAHTDANLSQGEAEYYQKLCSIFVQAMTVLGRGEGAADLGEEIGQPSFEAIEAFLLGAERRDEPDLEDARKPAP
jgi:hypothetical protein